MIEPVLPDFPDVLQAAARTAPHAEVTPVLHSRALDALSGAQLHSKAEYLQRGMPGAASFAILQAVAA